MPIFLSGIAVVVKVLPFLQMSGDQQVQPHWFRWKCSCERQRGHSYVLDSLTSPLYAVTSRLMPYCTSESSSASSAKMLSSLSQSLYHCLRDGLLMKRGIFSQVCSKNSSGEHGIRMSLNTPSPSVYWPDACRGSVVCEHTMRLTSSWVLSQLQGLLYKHSSQAAARPA